MRKWEWKKFALTMLSGAVLFQAPACAETAVIVTSISSVITAGGVIYLVARVLD